MRPISPIRPILLIGSVLLAVSVAAVLFSVAAASPQDNVSGWAWSSNIGWISFNNSNVDAAGPPYGVRVDAKGDIGGYAWSSNIGWVSFNQPDLAGCPQSPCAATFNRFARSVNGWARALAAGGGWDGWISLSGVAADGSPYGVFTAPGTRGCEWRGWAWGDQVVGWISFDGSGYGVQGTGDACTPTPQCSDALDNDGDGKIDFPVDPGCENPDDDAELDVPPPQCRDRVDNDADKKIDFPADPGCTDSDDPNEFDAPIPECKDGRDNDADGKIDFPADPGCADRDDPSEKDRPGIIEVPPR